MLARLTRVFLLLVITLASPVCWSNDNGAHVYPMPITEASSLIAGWLNGLGLQVAEQKTAQGQIRINGVNAHGSWEISLSPRSALSTAVSVHYNGERAPSRSPSDLHNYLLHSPTASTAGNSFHASNVPKPVQDKIESTVCIHSTPQDEPIEFSGFFIDRGLILSTAHGLRKQQRIIVVAYTGGEYQGEVVKLDAERDLALIRIHPDQAKIISLDTGRNLLTGGEKVYSIGCPANTRGKVYAGTINERPRRINQYPFWQAFIEVQPGSSGSPVFDEHGALVAVIKGRYRGTDTTGFLIPLETVMDFLRDFLAK